MPNLALDFPQTLSEKYRPRVISEFVGLDKPKKICEKLATSPFPSAWLFLGDSGVGKTTLALALADAIPAELHHIPSQQCNADRISDVRRICQYVPQTGKRMHLILVDEADQMTAAAQLALLSILDSTNFPPNTIFIFTANAVDKLEARFLSRLRTVDFTSYGIAKDAADLLANVWAKESNGAPAPNFARIVKESNNNIRAALGKLETELMLL